jgi:Domain of unknown function (DUF4340)
VNPLRSTAVHASLLILGAGAAAFAFTKERTPQAAQETNVVVWNGRASDLQRLVYEAKDKRIELEARDDKKGARWFLGKADYTVTPPAYPDGGVAPPTKRITAFSSVTAANKIAEGLVPFKAVRALGKIPDSRLAEFGLEKRETSLTLTFGGKERKVLVGSIAPGGTYYYVVDPTNNEAYVIKADALRELEGGDSRLLERDQHAFKEIDVRSAKVIANGKTRELVRTGPDTKKFWADAADKEKADETAGNWLAKIDRLKVSEYAAQAPEGHTVVLRIEYYGGPGLLGFLELAKGAPVASGQKPDYWIMTEHTHLWGKVYQVTAEQIEQDLGSVVR